jgi:hypothetical protein
VVISPKGWECTPRHRPCEDNTGSPDILPALRDDLFEIGRRGQLLEGAAPSVGT